MNFGQLLLTVTKLANPVGGGYGVGFNVQLLYGSEARVCGISGISDKWINKRNQLTPIEANIALHMQRLTKEGFCLLLWGLKCSMKLRALLEHQNTSYGARH